MTKRIVKSLDFSGPEAHVAIVPKAANGEEVLVMKMKEESTTLTKQDVRVELPMHEFLYTFYDMWYSDALRLSALLGYDSQETMEDDFGVSITLLKSIRGVNSLPTEIYSAIENLQKSVGDKLTNGTQTMSDEKETLIVPEDTDLQKQLEAVKADLLKFQTEAEANKTEVASLRKEREDAEKNTYTELVKGYTFVGEEADQVTLVDALMKGRSIPGFEVIVQTLEKAKKALDSVVLVEKGHSGESEDEAMPLYTSLATDILKNRA